MSRILLLEDDASLGQTLKERLEKDVHQVEWCKTVEQATAFVDRLKELDLAVLDVGLPDGSGFEFAQVLKSKKQTPLIFMTAQGAPEDRLRGYELGAEEYIPKPFHLKEFLIRVNHVLENHRVAKVISGSGFQLDCDSMTLTLVGQEPHALALKEYGVLSHLIKEAPRVISRDELLNAHWGEGDFPTNRTVDNVIMRLRQLLGEPLSRSIRSVRGVGYQWVEEEP